MKYKYIGKGKIVITENNKVKTLTYGDEVNVKKEDSGKFDSNKKFEKVVEEKKEEKEYKKKKEENEDLYKEKEYKKKKSKTKK